MQLYDSKTQSLRDFVAIDPGHVGMYVCGPTVQSAPHIGHLRSALVYDQLRRWLTTQGLDVTLVRNVTDIDDKILANAAAEGEAGEQWWALAYRIELDFNSAYAALGIAPPTYEPRATASIPEMQDLISRLINKGHAYVAEDGSADVYFDTASWASYGELTRQSLDNMDDAADSDPRGKRDPRDFALWKAHKPGEPTSAAWRSPWGSGRPGWHIECSAMSTKYLGSTFDIHGGGLDLRFPHHENELAQSAAAGDGFARYWLHNGLVSVSGQKMSKSLGNSLFAHELLSKARPIVLRYFLGSAHYRSTLEYSEGALEEAASAFERIESFLDRTARLDSTDSTVLQDSAALADLPSDFISAMDQDLAVPSALATLHDTVRAGNTAVDAGDTSAALAARRQVIAMTSVLGINPLSPQWQNNSTDSSALDALSVLVARLIEARAAARSARDFAAADTIRDQLTDAGISLEDTGSDTHWSING